MQERFNGYTTNKRGQRVLIDDWFEFLADGDEKTLHAKMLANHELHSRYTCTTFDECPKHPKGCECSLGGCQDTPVVKIPRCECEHVAHDANNVGFCQSREQLLSVKTTWGTFIMCRYCQLNHNWNNREKPAAVAR